VKYALIPILIACAAHAQSADPCGECDEGLVHGPSVITIEFTRRSFLDHSQCSGPDLCSRVQLNGTIDRENINTYDGEPVVLTGTFYTFDNDCCSFGPAGNFPIEGVAIAYYNDADGTVTADVDWGPVGSPFNDFATFGPSSGTCTNFSDTNNNLGGVNQIIEDITVTFTGGECIEDPDGGGGGGGGGEPPEPSEPPEPPTPDDPPDHDGPDDPPPPPDTEVDPDDPDIPDPPQPPAPPIDDLCCLAITSRLDNLLLYAEDTAQLHRNSNTHLENINTWLEAMYGALVSPDHGVWGLIPDIQRTLYDMRAYMGQMQALMLEDRDYQHDQTWYLQQIYAGVQGGDGGDLPEPGEEIDLGSAASGIAQLRIAHAQAQTEYGQEFSTPDIEEYTDSTDPLWQLPMGFARDAGVPFNDIVIDLTPYTGVRDIVRTSIILLVTLNAIFIVWGEFRKT
jgi:hypothetical protein